MRFEKNKLKKYKAYKSHQYTNPNRPGLKHYDQEQARHNIKEQQAQNKSIFGFKKQKQVERQAKKKDSGKKIFISVKPCNNR